MKHFHARNNADRSIASSHHIGKTGKSMPAVPVSRVVQQVRFKHGTKEKIVDTASITERPSNTIIKTITAISKGKNFKSETGVRSPTTDEQTEATIALDAISSMGPNKRQQANKIRMDGLAEEVKKANDEIVKLDASKKDFYKHFLDVPANIRASIPSLVEEDALKLDLEHTRIANFSIDLLKHFDIAGKTSEIQTAIISDKKTGDKSIQISGNKKESNAALKKIMDKKDLGTAYKDNIRPTHIQSKKRKLEEDIDGTTVDGRLLKKLRIDYRHKEGVFSSESGAKMNEDDLVKDVRKALLKYSHKQIKGDGQNRQMRSSRAFVRKGSLENVPVSIPDNEEEFHAESNILSKLASDTDKMIQAIGGTKVACVACQAYFTENNLAALLSDITSFAWLSKPCIDQLNVDNIENYLIKIYNTLKNRLANLRYYPESSGAILQENMTLDADDLTDSEDEDAMKLVDDDMLKNKATEIVRFIKEKYTF